MNGFQERLGVLAAKCAARKQLPLHTSAIRRALLIRYKQIKKEAISRFLIYGDEGIRTLDPLLARQVLSQLSYTPKSVWT